MHPAKICLVFVVMSGLAETMKDIEMPFSFTSQIFQKQLQIHQKFGNLYTLDISKVQNKGYKLWRYKILQKHPSVITHFSTNWSQLHTSLLWSEHIEVTSGKTEKVLPSEFNMLLKYMEISHKVLFKINMSQAKLKPALPSKSD